MTQTSQAVLALPGTAYRESFLEAMDEFTEADFQAMAFERRMATSDFEGYVRSVSDWSRGRHLPPGWVPVATYWLVEGNTYIGSVNIRHELNEYLRRWGGHIGYTIRPSRRRQGYGSEICRLALIESVKLGFDRVLITCDDDNPGSRKIIERNGGVLEDVVGQPDRNVPKRRYWVDLATITSR